LYRHGAKVNENIALSQKHMPTVNSRFERPRVHPSHFVILWMKKWFD
jgi:hypothetical protein